MQAPLRYHYKESGLDNIYLVNGFDFIDTPHGRAVNIRNIDGLHRAIGLMLAREKQNLTGKEFRFLRHEMGLTQRDLAAILRVDVQSVARWEKGQTKRPIDGPAQGLIRVMYEQYIGGNERIVDPIKRLAELDEIINDGEVDEDISFEDTEEGWQPAMAA
jgi:putative transcriptional regulator